MPTQNAHIGQKGDPSPFDLSATTPDGRAALLVHGFTGTPFAMRFLGEKLAAAGLRALAIALPGHGPDQDNLARSTADDWRAAVDEALDKLRRDHDSIALIGQSMGALLSLEVAADHPSTIESLAALATPLWLEGAAGVATKILRVLPRAIPLPSLDKGESDCKDDDARTSNPANDKIPLTALREFDRVRRRALDALPRVTTPIIALHATHDHTAPYASSPRLLERVGSQQTRLVTLENSYHLISIDVDRDLVAREIAQFLARTMATPTRAPGAVQTPP